MYRSFIGYSKCECDYRHKFYPADWGVFELLLSILGLSIPILNMLVTYKTVLYHLHDFVSKTINILSKVQFHVDSNTKYVDGVLLL